MSNHGLLHLSSIQRCASSTAANLTQCKPSFFVFILFSFPARRPVHVLFDTRQRFLLAGSSFLSSGNTANFSGRFPLSTDYTTRMDAFSGLSAFFPSGFIRFARFRAHGKAPIYRRYPFNMPILATFSPVSVFLFPTGGAAAAGSHAALSNFRLIFCVFSIVLLAFSHSPVLYFGKEQQSLCSFFRTDCLLLLTQPAPLTGTATRL